MQFRYATKYIDASVLKAIDEGHVVGQNVLIAYADQSGRTALAPVPLVPCRSARISSCLRLGTTVSLRLELNKFASVSSIDAFNAEVLSITARATPQRTGEGKISGFYCIRLPSELTTVGYSSEFSTFENLINLLILHSDFASEQTFCSLSGVFKVGKSSSVVPVNGRFPLEGGSQYYLHVYQYHPTSAPSNTSLTVTSTSDRLTFIDQTTFVLDSRYDHKEISFELSRSLDDRLGVVRFELKQSEELLTLDLAFKLHGSVVLGAMYAIVLGALLASPHAVSALVNDKIAPATQHQIVVTALVTSLIASSLTVFGVRKLL